MKRRMNKKQKSKATSKIKDTLMKCQLEKIKGGDDTGGFKVPESFICY